MNKRIFIISLLSALLSAAVGAAPEQSYLIIYNATGRDGLVVQSNGKDVDKLTLETGANSGGLLVPARKISLNLAQDGAPQATTTFDISPRATVRLVATRSTSGPGTPAELHLSKLELPARNDLDQSRVAFVFNGASNPIETTDEEKSPITIAQRELHKLGKIKAFERGLTFKSPESKDLRFPSRMLNFEEPADALIILSSDPNGQIIGSVVPLLSFSPP